MPSTKISVESEGKASSLFVFHPRGKKKKITCRSVESTRANKAKNKMRQRQHSFLGADILWGVAGDNYTVAMVGTRTSPVSKSHSELKVLLVLMRHHTLLYQECVGHITNLDKL